MLADIVAAIQQQRTLTINYAPGLREIEPHAVGYGSGGQILLRAFQTSGVSASGKPVNWKLFRVGRLGGAPQAGGHFVGPRPGYRRGDSAMTGGVIAQL